MDPFTAGVIIAGLPTVGKPTADALAGMFARILGPSADALGEGIAAPLQAWAKKRGERASKTVLEAAELLERAGVEPQPVPGRILMPVLEHASLEDDPELQHKWAALLANAATAGEVGKVLPAFTDILRVLTPVHARMLDWMFAQEEKADVPAWFSTWPDFDRETITQEFNLSPADYALLITDMERLRLIEGSRKVWTDPEADLIAVTQWMLAQLKDREKYRTIALTAMGVRFMQACQPPSAANLTDSSRK